MSFGGCSSGQSHVSPRFVGRGEHPQLRIDLKIEVLVQPPSYQRDGWEDFRLGWHFLSYWTKPRLVSSMVAKLSDSKVESRLYKSRAKADESPSELRIRHPGQPQLW
jgi:hypothetical protein